MKSILSAFASFAAVRKEKFTSCRSTLVMYGRDTFMRRASSVCETPSSFIRRKMRRRNAEPIRSIALIVRSWRYELELRVGVSSWSWRLEEVGVRSWRTAKIPTSSIDSLKIKTYYSPTPTKLSNSN